MTRHEIEKKGKHMLPFQIINLLGTSDQLKLNKIYFLMSDKKGNEAAFINGKICTANNEL